MGGMLGAGCGFHGVPIASCHKEGLKDSTAPLKSPAVPTQVLLRVSDEVEFAELQLPCKLLHRYWQVNKLNDWDGTNRVNLYNFEKCGCKFTFTAECHITLACRHRANEKIFKFEVLTALKLPMLDFCIATSRGFMGRYQTFGGIQAYFSCEYWGSDFPRNMHVAFTAHKNNMDT
jgi:hypothetical protein